jgi:hypothetical protein
MEGILILEQRHVMRAFDIGMVSALEIKRS